MMVLAGAAFAASLVSLPASAAPSPSLIEANDVSAAAWSDCPAARMCIWTGLDGNGGIGYFANGDANLGAAPGPSGLNNTAESAWNRSGSRFCFYDGANYSGFLGDVLPGEQGNIKPEYRNRISSLKTC
ncbi:peptidase inhibitor family I36 [Lentzea atacamensis]|uniref:Peptidase inhibitor family I36 n=2 Tax=Lentzea TaxID=165301 RepID=A0A316HWM8_9PSEU|nr:peptidase inhibitor family I36 [Lentzea atacamensis]RAS66906.1 peptidase inhibitor family I36 [Lentzea atacamensis]